MRAIFSDISKAFDRVWHKGLLYKLSYDGISGSLIQWLTDYLNNRQQRVVLPGTASNFSPGRCSSRFDSWPSSFFSLY